MKTEVTGVKELQASMKKLGERYGKAVAKAAAEAAQIVRTEAIQSIQDVSQGEEVTRTRNGGNQYKHIASKAGDAPNTDTGRLVSSVQVEITAKYVYVGTSLKYGAWLEYGTRAMNARPWLYPALERKRKEIVKLFKSEVDFVTKKGLT